MLLQVGGEKSIFQPLFSSRRKLSREETLSGVVRGLYKGGGGGGGGKCHDAVLAFSIGDTAGALRCAASALFQESYPKSGD